MNQTFKKSERLCHQKAIETLFSRNEGQNRSFLAYPIKVVYRVVAEAPTTQVLFSVSKRNFKRAVTRNVLKRRLREAYRLHKAAIATLPSLQIAFIYVGKVEEPYATIERGMKKAFRLLQHEVPTT